MTNKVRSLIVETMQNSKCLSDEIFKFTELGKDFDTGIFNFEFKKDAYKDLYYAVQNVNMRVIGTNLGDSFWNIKVKS